MSKLVNLLRRQQHDPASSSLKKDRSKKELPKKKYTARSQFQGWFVERTKWLHPTKGWKDTLA